MDWFSHFNPRSHGGSDADKAAESERQAISIHAPTGGATLARLSLSVFRGISIHAPTGGATCSKVFFVFS